MKELILMISVVVIGVFGDEYNYQVNFHFPDKIFAEQKGSITLLKAKTGSWKIFS